jgi:hypothetical protein
MPGFVCNLAAQRLVRWVLQEHQDPRRCQCGYHGILDCGVCAWNFHFCAVQSRKSCLPLVANKTDIRFSQKTSRRRIKSSHSLPSHQSFSSAFSLSLVSPASTPLFHVFTHPSSQHYSSSSLSPAVSVYISRLKRAPCISATPPSPCWCSSSTPSCNPASGGAAPHTHEQTTERDLERKMTRWSCWERWSRAEVAAKPA